MAPRPRGNQFTCSICKETLQLIGTDADNAETPLIFSCPNCEALFRKAQPEGWVDNTKLYGNIKALQEGRSIKQDDRMEEAAIDEAIEKLMQLDPRSLDHEQLRLLTGQLTIAGFLKNVRSRRPSVRQRALEALASLTMPKAPQQIDLNLGTDKLTTDEIIEKSEANLVRIKELRALKEGKKD